MVSRKSLWEAPDKFPRRALVFGMVFKLKTFFDLSLEVRLEVSLNFLQKVAEKFGSVIYYAYL